jgi:hypothetical protein
VDLRSDEGAVDVDVVGGGVAEDRKTLAELGGSSSVDARRLEVILCKTEAKSQMVVGQCALCDLTVREVECRT